MPLIKSSKRSGQPRLAPFYAAVGVTDRAVEALRDLGAKDADPSNSPVADLANVVRGVVAVPSLAVNGARSLLDVGQAQYEEFTKHGQKTVREVVSPARLLGGRGSGPVDAETAKKERAARRLARQAGTTVTRASTTLRSVREEAENVVDAVTHPGPIPTRSDRSGAQDTSDSKSSLPTRPRRPRRLPATSDPAVRSTNPTAPEESTNSPSSGVEAGGTAATQSARKSAAKKSASVTASEDGQSQVKKGAAKKAAVRKSAAKKSAPRKAPATTTVAKAAAVAATPSMPSVIEDLVEGSAFGDPQPSPIEQHAEKDSDQQS
ncbi:hypothetical protein [Gephyromycinifex aptenodytis]|uniref:hypothetical protein n=1 Tax=Gephyromycinifex aptenodytis TaxID=2716227 RepID=UPI0014466906|nr:hypothetical protein [Gephyromycinifex aptenodytis]